MYDRRYCFISQRLLTGDVWYWTLLLSLLLSVTYQLWAMWKRDKTSHMCLLTSILSQPDTTNTCKDYCHRGLLMQCCATHQHKPIHPHDAPGVAMSSLMAFLNGILRNRMRVRLKREAPIKIYKVGYGKNNKGKIHDRLQCNPVSF